MSESSIEKKSTLFGQKVSALSNLMSDTSSRAQNKEGGGFPMIIIAGLIVPFIIFSGLFFGKPSIVKNPESDERDNTKVFYWTLLITVVIWVLMYIGMYCSGSYSPTT